MSAAVMILAALFSAGDRCDAPRTNSKMACSDRVGHCFDLEIDGQRVTPLDDDARRAELREVVTQAVCWRLETPVAGTLEPRVSANEFTAAHLGELFDEVEIVVTGLEGQQIPTKKGIRTDPTVRIGGLPMQTMVDVIDVEALPDGAYVATFRVRGPGGWDRKAVHLTVARGQQ